MRRARGKLKARRGRDFARGSLSLSVNDNQHGPATMVWGWMFVSFATLPLAFSMAEIGAKYPTSAGAYYWTFTLAPPRYRRLLSWIDGWLLVTGFCITSVSVTFGVARFIIAEVQIFYPDWVATQWQTYFIFLSVTIIGTLPGIFFNSYLPLVDTLSAWCSLLGVIVIAISLSIKAAVGRRSAAFALAYTSMLLRLGGHLDGLSSSVSIVCLYLLRDWSGMAEEVEKPSVQVPAAMTPEICAICGLTFLLPILFTLPNIETLLAIHGGQPIGLMFELIMGSKTGGFGMWFIVLLVAIFCCISLCCAASRMTWSFARDHANPLLLDFLSINKRLGSVPLNAYLLSTVIQLLVGLLDLGSTAAFDAHPLANGRNGVEGTPFYMGKIKGPVVNVCAVLWMLLQIVLFSMPAVIPVTQTSMNYASVVYVGFAVISIAWYMIDGRFILTEPLSCLMIWFRSKGFLYSIL
ncbi:hypothetical protein APHAL10511_007607 [Amanita phalloides]|nr:hypothetical protein APHAL10511_007607 [Amanita phalloides]